MTTIWRSIWGRLVAHSLLKKWRVSLIRSYRPQHIVMLTESCTEIWNHRTYWFISTETSSWQTSVSHVHSASQWRHTHTRLWHCGTVPQKSSWDKSSIQLQLTSGRLAASLLKWLKERRFLLETLKSTRFSRSSKSRAPPMKPTGPQHWSCLTSRLPSLNGRESLCRSTRWILRSMA